MRYLVPVEFEAKSDEEAYKLLSRLAAVALRDYPEFITRGYELSKEDKSFSEIANVIEKVPQRDAG